MRRNEVGLPRLLIFCGSPLAALVCRNPAALGLSVLPAAVRALVHSRDQV